jgi:hypothetical protein
VNQAYHRTAAPHDGVTREQIVAELWNETINRELLSAQQRARAKTGPGGDGEETCRVAAHAALAESEATHRAENQLLVKGPVPAQEAAAFVHLVKRASLARAKGGDTVKLYVPKEAEVANVSKATMTRALNKLRAAEAETLPFTVNDSWRGGKQRVAIKVPSTIGDEDWTERRAYLTLSRAKLAEERKKQGGSEEAVKARWSCPAHPDDAVIETTTKHYRCTACERSYAPPPTVRRHSGGNDPIQVESRDPADAVEIFGASFAAEAVSDPIQVETVTSLREKPHQVESGQSGPVSFVSRDDLEWADTPNYLGEAPPEPPAWSPPPVAPRHHRAWTYRRPPSRAEADAPASSTNGFVPSAEWQLLPDGYQCPPGGEFRMDFQTGKNWARWPAQEGAAP